MKIDTQAACKLLLEQDNIVILAHQKPDGDTLGSSFALYYALKQLGKQVRVECADGFPARYDFIYGDYIPETFRAEYVVTSDVASLPLLGKLREVYGDRIDLCIDHHKSNEIPARHTLLDAGSPAASQIMYGVIKGLGVQMELSIANALYTGLSTDTGCFKYDNVIPQTHRIAADLIEAGADHGEINKRMFDNKSKGRLEVEKQLMESLEYHFDDRCALITIYTGLTEQYGVEEDELDGISAIPRRIEGVLAGVTIRERQDGTHRISLRTGGGLDASKICSRMGGGGHMNAAGCTLEGDRAEVKAKLLAEIKQELDALA